MTSDSVPITGSAASARSFFGTLRPEFPAVEIVIEREQDLSLFGLHADRTLDQAVVRRGAASAFQVRHLRQGAVQGEIFPRDAERLNPEIEVRAFSNV